MMNCPQCQATGVLKHQWLHGGGKSIYSAKTVTERQICPFCNGTGQVVQCECGIWSASDREKCTCGKGLV